MSREKNIDYKPQRLTQSDVGRWVVLRSIWNDQKSWFSFGKVSEYEARGYTVYCFGSKNTWPHKQRFDSAGNGRQLFTLFVMRFATDKESVQCEARVQTCAEGVHRDTIDQIWRSDSTEPVAITPFAEPKRVFRPYTLEKGDWVWIHSRDGAFHKWEQPALVTDITVKYIEVTTHGTHGNFDTKLKYDPSGQYYDDRSADTYLAAYVDDADIPVLESNQTEKG